MFFLISSISSSAISQCFWIVTYIFRACIPIFVHYRQLKIVSTWLISTSLYCPSAHEFPFQPKSQNTILHHNSFSHNSQQTSNRNSQQVYQQIWIHSSQCWRVIHEGRWNCWELFPDWFPHRTFLRSKQMLVPWSKSIFLKFLHLISSWLIEILFDVRMDDSSCRV